jgi:hypothetical protein
MASARTDIERLRARITTTIEHGTTLLGDLKSLDDELIVVLPLLQDMAQSERERVVARLCGYEATLPDQLRGLIEGLADLVAGLTTTDGAAAWRRHQRERLAAGDSEEAA